MPKAEYSIRVLFVFVLFTGMFAGVARWLYHLQVERHDEFLAKAQKVYTATYERTASRGRIFDHGGNLLAGSQQCFDVFLEPRRLPRDSRDELIQQLIVACAADEELVNKRVKTGRIEIVVKRGMELGLRQSVQELNIPGVRFVDSYQRTYPKGRLASVVLGFMGSNGGAAGIDKVYEPVLKAKPGKFEYERNRKGQIKYDSVRTLVPPVAGKDVYLTIREPLQDIAEEELARLCQEFTPQYAYAIMADPKTGAILAFAQAPAFDPNDRGEMNPKLWRNHAVEDTLEPGSTMKAPVICGALDYGVTNLNDEFYCEKGQWLYGGKILRDSHGYEWLKVWEIVQYSSNIGTAKIALRLGDPRLYQVFRRFGFYERTGIELPLESRGRMLPLSKWDVLTPTRYPIGKTWLVTPLQMVQAYCGLANKGRIMKLHLMDRIVNPATGKTVFKHKDTVHRVAAREEAVADTVQALKTVTEAGGTGTKARVDGYHVAGKTGTSRKLVNGSYEGHRKYWSSFIGFVPAEAPAFVLLVVADEPQGKWYGGTVCGPAFSRISARALRYLNVPQDVAFINRDQPGE